MYDLRIMTEEWRPVPGFLMVEASNRGRVRRDGRILTPRPHPYDGRWSVYIGRAGGGNYQSLLVGRLVCLAFHGPPPTDKPNALHRNGIPTDDRPSNLYWGTSVDNATDMVRHGTSLRGKRNPHVKLTDDQVRQIRRRRAAGERGAALAREFNITRGTVCNIHKGYSWGWLKK